MPSTSPETKDIRIGLVLAGAITAGAYTAGVLDYFFNTLQAWQDAYDTSPNDVPKPNVKVEVITGASAGSMAGAIALIALALNKLKPITDIHAPDNAENNLLYRAWVDYALSPGESILESLLATGDMENDAPQSLLNTKFIDDLVKNLEQEISQTPSNKLPAYISSNLQVLMTMSNLRGIPIKLSFSNDPSGQVPHVMNYHKAYAKFQYTGRDANGVAP